MLRIIQNRKYYYAFSGLIALASLAAVLAWGFKPGIDFTGGSQLEVAFRGGARPETAAMSDTVRKTVAEGELTVQPIGDDGLMVRMPSLTETQHQALLASIKDAYAKGDVTVEESSFESIGPVIGAELRAKTVYAVISAIVVIVLYITYVFRKVSHPVASWKYGLCNIAALAHDVVIPSGLFAILGHFANVEVGAWVVTALLTVLGFSVHDTIVVFDRIRENLSKSRRENFEDLVNRSVNETLARSLNTSLTVLLVLGAAWFFGGASTKDFILTIFVGILSGTYSSIFVASPLLVTWQLRDAKRR